MELRSPPPLPETEGAGGVLANVVPMVGSIGSMASSTAEGHRYTLLASGLLVATTLALAGTQLHRERRRHARSIAASRTEYLHHLESVRTRAREAATRQRAALLWRHPDPVALPALAEERTRVWERAVTDPQFLHVRYGVCSRPLSLELVPPDSAPSDRVDPAAASALHRLLAVHRVQPDLPTAVDLRAVDRIEIRGHGSTARSLARAMICSAAVFQSPEHLALAVLASGESLPEWDWVKWLPHALSGQDSDAVGQRRMVSSELSDLAGLLPRQPHVLFVVDGAGPPSGDHLVPPRTRPGMTVLEIVGRCGEEDDSGRPRLLVGDRAATDDDRPTFSARPLREPAEHARVDQCDLVTAESLARRLAPLVGVTAGDEGHPASGGEIPGPSDLMDLLGLGDIHAYDAVAAWSTRRVRDRLRVPIGVGDAGTVVHLDIKESAQRGMGPHGLVIGSTGSGKSELLRTLVLGLALTHSPEHLNMVLVDFKGGATFAGMSAMPHVSAVITNLANELALVDRMQDALSGEMVRRQELLRQAGHFASVLDYERARAAGGDLVPLPSLFIAVDEFSEMLSAKPELLELLITIGRVGRSLGLHLLLASQHLEEGRLRGLESHLSYRVALRTFSAQESRTALGAPDAYEMPPMPGLGFLKPDRSTLLRFRAAYVSGPPAGARAPAAGRDQTRSEHGFLPWTSAEVRVPVRPQAATPLPTPPGGRHSLLDVAIERMKEFGPPAHQVWLPPLDVPDTLDGLMADIAPDPRLGLVSRKWRARGGLTVPLGTVDRPHEQRRDTLTVDLSGSTGHVGVVGGPRAGKSTFLRTLVASLSLTTTPVESQFFVLDFGGGTFAAMHSLPHLAGIGTRSEPDVVRRIVAEVTGIVDMRETYFRSSGIDSIETYRTRRAEDRADDGYGDVFLVVDGWSTLRADFDGLELELQQLASRGLTFGFHLLTASTRWSDYRAAVRDLLGSRLELRLGDPMDSEIDRKLATLVPPSRPGRGLVPGKLHVLCALPRIDGDPDVGTLGDGVAAMVARVTDEWHGPAGPKLRLLPERLTAAELIARADEEKGAASRLLLGVDERELAPVGLDPDTDPHWLILGDGRSGKSAALRGYLHEVMRTRTPKQAQLVVVDYRRSLLGEVPDEYLLSYLTSAALTAPALAELASYLESRMPGPDVTPEQLRRRSWWTGAEVFVVVDDYDLVATAHGSPVQALQPLLAQARDVGLRLVVARRSGGASRAVYEPVIQTLRDLATPGLLLSGSPEEGPLIGNVRPTPGPAGRGRLVTRDGGVEVVQLAWRNPSV
jgi:S-DNA-T family DNA segregation ATPase FtsK/SpoIIIE